MKRLTSFILIFSTAVLSASAQRYQPYINAKPVEEEWSAHPKVHPVPPEFAKEHEIMLLNDVSLDYRAEGESLNMYTSEHRIIKVLDDRGIEHANNIEIPVYFDTRVPLIKARVIQPNGKIKEINKEMMLVTRNPNGYHSVVIAMEGVEKNAEVEVLVKEIHPASYFGGFHFQFPMPVMETHFNMACPKSYYFAERGYNGFPTVKDTLKNNRRRLSISLYDIPKLRPEPNSFYDLYTMRAEYRLDHNYGENAYNKLLEYTWDSVGRQIYNNYYRITEKEKAAVNEYLSELGIRQTTREYDKMKKIETGIKTTIAQYDYIEYDERREVLANNHIRSVSVYDVAHDKTRNPLDSILSRRSASEAGILKLFIACFVQSGVDFELGFASNRHEHIPNSEFVNWNNLSEPLFYFPKTKKFLDPIQPLYRYPMVPEELVGNRGVFCTIPPNGFVTGPVMKMRKVEALPAAASQSNIAAAVSFGKDMDAQIDVSYSFTGYPAAELRTSLMTMPKDKQEDFVTNIVSFGRKEGEIRKYTISNETPDNYYTNKPLEVTATVNTSSLTEDAGKNILFKVGKIIGKRQALYDEDERVLPVDLEYPHMFNRTITLNLPVGYKVLNPEVLRKNAEYVNRDIEPVISFHSDYKLIADKKKGDKLVINVSESYIQLHFSPQYYERYRDVVNAAADFSNAALIISPKANGKKERVKPDPRISKK